MGTESAQRLAFPASGLRDPLEGGTRLSPLSLFAVSASPGWRRLPRGGPCPSPTPHRGRSVPRSRGGGRKIVQHPVEFRKRFVWRLCSYLVLTPAQLELWECPPYFLSAPPPSSGRQCERNRVGASGTSGGEGGAGLEEGDVRRIRSATLLGLIQREKSPLPLGTDSTRAAVTI